MTYGQITSDIIELAKQADIIAFLKEKHPGTIHLAAHPDTPQFVCWRSKKHDSLTFFSHKDASGQTIYRFKRHSTGQSDDCIAYLMKYENYTFSQAVIALAWFSI